MEGKNPVRLTLGKHSSLAPEREPEESDVDVEGIDPGLRLMIYSSCFRTKAGQIDLKYRWGSTMLYILQNHDVIKLLENRGAGAKPLFLGAVTQSCPMMNVTVYLSKGSLGAFLKRKGALERIAAVRLALDIARLIEECWHDNKAK
ncbi:hypothetical protein NC652_027742 [Populus alba x Populus x berolinensis]|nr:hypothetical protein NC652_027742 [Populus alba x Populus x berolinensis]